MGILKVEVEIINPTDESKRTSVSGALIDTGSELTWIPEDRLRSAGIVPRKKGMRFVMANGQTISRDVGYAIVKSGEFESNDEVVFAQAGDLPLLGARTLEGFNARVDFAERRLVAAGPMPAAGNVKSWDAV